VRHLTEIERNYLPDPLTDSAVRQAFGTWEAECARSRRIVAGTASLDQVNAKGTPLRWVLLYVLREYARHNGHADLLRQAIDGTTGE
jgi:Protein of unknown function (DUF664)